jgi:hypothetical protein
MTVLSYKATVLAGQIRDALLEKFTTVSEVLNDASGIPYVTVGSLVAGSDSAVVVVNTLQPLGVDGLGLTPRGFSPHNLRLIMEKGPTGEEIHATAAAVLKIMGAVLKFGVQTDIYMTAHDTVVAVDAVCVYKATFNTSNKYGTMSSI